MTSIYPLQKMLNLLLPAVLAFLTVVFGAGAAILLGVAWLSGSKGYPGCGWLYFLGALISTLIAYGSGLYRSIFYVWLALHVFVAIFLLGYTFCYGCACSCSTSNAGCCSSCCGEKRKSRRHRHRDARGRPYVSFTDSFDSDCE